MSEQVLSRDWWIADLNRSLRAALTAAEDYEHETNAVLDAYKSVLDAAKPLDGLPRNGCGDADVLRFVKARRTFFAVCTAVRGSRAIDLGEVEKRR